MLHFPLHKKKNDDGFFTSGNSMNGSPITRSLLWDLTASDKREKYDVNGGVAAK